MASCGPVTIRATTPARGATVVVPPARTANVSAHGPRSPARNRTITLVKQLGRRRWKKKSGYHRQGRVENTFFRYKSIIGDGLRARSPAGQGSEAVLGCEIRRCCMKTLRGGALLVTLRRSHTIGMQSKVHPTYKTKYRVANWAAYNQALVRRGDVTVWVSSEAIAAWTPGRSGLRGGQRRYSDLAIETALTLRLIYHLPLRQAEGFLHALFGMMRLDLSAPDYTTLSRRSQHLRRRLRPVSPDEGIHLVLDSTGLSIVGAGEWAAAKHGGCGRRGWRKLHLGVDQSGVILVHTLTEATGDDATIGLDLLNAVEGPLVRVTADAAYDTVAVYETAGARGATVVVPPARTANVSGHGPRSPARDRTIQLVKQLGRRQWKKVSGYHRQGRVENAFFRYKSIIGDSLRARSPAGQGSEAVLGCEILNRMTALGRPVSYRIGR